MSFPAPLNSNIKTARIHLKIMKRNTSKNILKTKINPTQKLKEKAELKNFLCLICAFIKLTTLVEGQQ